MITISDTCAWDNCNQQGRHLVAPNKYCSQHYEQLLKKRFQDLYDAWGKADFVDDDLGKMMECLSRYLRYIFDMKGWPFGLSGAKIRDRMYDCIKIPGGMIFSIERHYNAFSDYKPTINTEHIYQYKLEGNIFELICEHDNYWINKLAHEIAWAVIRDQDHPILQKRKSRKFGYIQSVKFSAVKDYMQHKVKMVERDELRELIQKYALFHGKINNIELGKELAFLASE